MAKKKRGKKTVKPKQTKRARKTTRKTKTKKRSPSHIRKIPKKEVKRSYKIGKGKVKIVYKKEAIRGEPKSPRSLKMDKTKAALPPGKRVSRSGKVYYEYRYNHSDLNRRKRL